MDFINKLLFFGAITAITITAVVLVLMFIWKFFKLFYGKYNRLFKITLCIVIIFTW